MSKTLACKKFRLSRRNTHACVGSYIRVMKNVLHNEKGRGHPKPVSEEKLMPSILKDINIMFPLLNENCTLSPMSCEYLCISECKCAHRPFYKTSWHYI
jgi:hypothetical protein